jgi:HlyD family secretion protein
MTIADMSDVNVEVKVDETEIANVEVGQPAKIKIDAFQEREVMGSVVQKTPLAIGKSATQGGLSNQINVQEAKEFRVVVRVDKSSLPKDIHEGLKPGMSATATITTKVVPDAIAVPLQAIVEKAPTPGQPPAAPPNATQQPTSTEKPKDIKGVYVLEGNKVKFREVTTGITGESDIQILEGVAPGMEIITGPSRVLKTLKDEAAVKRQERKPGDNANTSEK